MPLHPELDATLRDILGLLPSSDLATLALHAFGGTREALADTVSAQAGRELREAREKAIPAPSEVRSAEDQAAWRAAAERAAQAPAGEHGVDCALPSHVRDLDRRAADATSKLSGAHVRLVQGERELRRHVERWALDCARDGAETTVDLRRQVRTWGFVRVVLWLAEGLGVASACWSQAGILDYPHPWDAPFSLWMSAWMTTLPALIATFGVVEIGGFLLSKLGIGRWGVVTSLMLTVAIGVVVMVSVSGLKWAGQHTGLDVSAWVVEVGGDSVIALVSCAIVIASVIACHLGERIKALRASLREAEQRETLEREERALLEKDVANAKAELAALQVIVDAPSTMAIAFERTVMVTEQRLAEEARIVAERVARACAVWDRVQFLPEIKRERLSSEIWTWVKAPANAINGKGTLLSLLFVVLLPLTLGTMLSGCTPAAQPQSVIVGCDGTGVDQTQVCTSDFLRRAFAGWADTGSFVPGSTFEVMPSAGSFGTTKGAVTLTVPPVWEGRMARVDWIRAGLNTVGAVVIPVDDGQGRGRRPNKSDLVSLVRVMARDAKSLPDGDVRAVIASDGWFVSPGMDTESGAMPARETFLAAANADGGTPDLSVFSSATWCGLHGLGSTSKKTAERDDRWRDLFVAGHGPVFDSHPSCDGLFPPVSTKLLGGAVAPDTQVVKEDTK